MYPNIVGGINIIVNKRMQVLENLSSNSKDIETKPNRRHDVHTKQGKSEKAKARYNKSCSR